MVRHAPARDLNQPATRVIGNTLLRPLGESGDHGLLHGIFGGGEVAEAASDGAEHLRRKFTQQMLDPSVVLAVGHVALFSVRVQRPKSACPLRTGRTSMGMFAGFPPGPGACETRAAI